MESYDLNDKFTDFKTKKSKDDTDDRNHNENSIYLNNKNNEGELINEVIYELKEDENPNKNEYNLINSNSNEIINIEINNEKTEEKEIVINDSEKNIAEIKEDKKENLLDKEYTKKISKKKTLFSIIEEEQSVN